MGFAFALFVLLLFVGVPLFIIYACYRSDAHRHERLPNEAGRSTEVGTDEGRGPQPEGPLIRPSTGLSVASALAVALAIYYVLHPSPPSTHRTLLGVAHMLLAPIFGNYTDAAFMLLGSVCLFVVAKHSRATGK